MVIAVTVVFAVVAVFVVVALVVSVAIDSVAWKLVMFLFVLL